MDSSEFDGAVRALVSERYPDAPTRAFAHLALRLAFPDMEFTDDKAEEIVSIDRSGDLGCDGLYIDRDERRVLLFQAKSSRSLSDSELRRDLSEFLAVPQRLESTEWLKVAHSDLQRLANEYEDAILQDCTVTFAFVTGSALPAKVRAVFAPADQETPDRQLVMLDIADLEDRYRKLLLGEPGADTDVRFSGRAGELHQPPSAQPVTYLTIPARQYVQACKPYSNELFRYNPRLYLGRNKVNTAIANTLANVGERDFFHLLNNGITAVCRELRVEVAPDGSWTCDAANFQVVNGCQTSMTLFEKSALLHEHPNILVDVKIIESEGLRDLISLTTNTQTSIVAEDAFANDDDQIRIRSRLEQYNPPYFYAHKRGLWERLKDPEKRAYEYGNPARFRKYRKLTSKELAAVCLAAFGQPEDAKDKPRIAFELVDGKPSTLHRRIFSDPKFAQQWLLPFELFGFANTLVKSAKARVAEVQARFDQTGANSDKDELDDADRRLRIGEYGRFRVVHLAYRYLKEQISFDGDLLPGDISQTLLSSIDDWAPNLADMSLDCLVTSFRDAQKADETTGLREFFRETSHQQTISENFRTVQTDWRRMASRESMSLNEYLKVPIEPH